MSVLTEIDKSKLPAHIAIVMDGNGRWATSRGMARTEGHRRGTDSVSDVVRAARELGVKHLTLYAFSTQNWRRLGFSIEKSRGISVYVPGAPISAARTSFEQIASDLEMPDTESRATSASPETGPVFILNIALQFPGA